MYLSNKKKATGWQPDGLMIGLFAVDAHELESEDQAALFGQDWCWHVSEILNQAKAFVGNVVLFDIIDDFLSLFSGCAALIFGGNDIHQHVVIRSEVISDVGTAVRPETR